MWESTDFLEVSVRRNTTTPVGFEIWDEVDNKAVDLSEYTIICRVAHTDGSNSLATIQAINLELVHGWFDMIFDGSAYSALPGTQEDINLALQILGQSTKGDVTIASGKLILKPGIN